MGFYVSLAEDSTPLQQGDILASAPFSYFPLQQAKVVLSNGGVESRDLSEDPRGVEYVSAGVEFSWGMVLNQTCDLQPDPQTGHARRLLLVARVRPIKELHPTFEDDTVKKSLGSVTALANPGRSPVVFYLPAIRTAGVDFPRSGSHLLDVQRFDPRDLPAIRRLAKLRLSMPALQALQERCAYCFGRFGAPDSLFLSPEEWAERQRQEQARSQSRPR